jgi:hypothetical protein
LLHALLVPTRIRSGSLNRRAYGCLYLLVCAICLSTALAGRTYSTRWLIDERFCLPIISAAMLVASIAIIKSPYAGKISLLHAGSVFLAMFWASFGLWLFIQRHIPQSWCGNARPSFVLAAALWLLITFALAIAEAISAILSLGKQSPDRAIDVALPVVCILTLGTSYYIFGLLNGI